MRYTGEVRIRLHGDREAAALLIPHARTLLGGLMARNAAISEGRIGPKLSDSVISNLPREPLGVIQQVAGPIRVGVYGGLPIIDIYAPGGRRRVERIPWGLYFRWWDKYDWSEVGPIEFSEVYEVTPRRDNFFAQVERLETDDYPRVYQAYKREFYYLAVENNTVDGVGEICNLRTTMENDIVSCYYLEENPYPEFASPLPYAGQRIVWTQWSDEYIYVYLNEYRKQFIDGNPHYDYRGRIHLYTHAGVSIASREVTNWLVFQTPDARMSITIPPGIAATPGGVAIMGANFLTKWQYSEETELITQAWQTTIDNSAYTAEGAAYNIHTTANLQGVFTLSLAGSDNPRIRIIRQMNHETGVIEKEITHEAQTGSGTIVHDFACTNEYLVWSDFSFWLPEWGFPVGDNHKYKLRVYDARTLTLLHTWWVQDVHAALDVPDEFRDDRANGGLRADYHAVFNPMEERVIEEV